MAIKDLIEQVRSKLTAEQVEAIGSVLKSLENEVIDLQNSLSAANAESKGRKLKLRELEEKLQDYEIEKSEWQKKLDELDKRLKDDSKDATIKELQAKLNTFLTKEKNSFINSFESISKHPKFEKAKTKFVLPEQDKDGKYLWDKLDDKSWEQNINYLNELNELDYFESGHPKTPSPVKGGHAASGYTREEILKIREEFGPNSPQYKKALNEYVKEGGLVSKF